MADALRALAVALLMLSSLHAAAAPFLYASYATGPTAYAIAVIDLASNTLAATIPVDTGVVGLGVNAAGTRLYVLSGTTNRLAVVDTATNRVITTVSLGAPPSTPLLSLPNRVIVSPNGNRVYITAVANTQNSVYVLDATTNTVIATVPLAGSLPQAYPLGGAINPAGSKLYVLDPPQNLISIVDTSTNTLSGSISTGSNSSPDAVAINPQGTRLYVANGGRSSFSIFDLATNALVSSPALPGFSGYTDIVINPAGTRVYLSNSQSIAVFDASTGSQVAVMSLGYGASAIAIDSAGRHVYAPPLLFGSRGTAVIDTATNSVTATIPIPAGTSASSSLTALSIGPSQPFPVTASVFHSNATGNDSLSAQVQPRSQDSGTVQSIYVFFYAPKSLAHALSKNSPIAGSEAPTLEDDGCTLAQTQADGTFRAVGSVSGLTALMTSVLNAQGQAVTLLNNVSSPNVAGATVYVGYGTSPGTMVSNGTYQAVQTIPGTLSCVASPDVVVTPPPVQSYEGLWLKPDEGGWGVNVTHQGSIVFATWFTYDTDGSGMWLVMSNGYQAAAGLFQGNLYRTVGPAFNATPFSSIVQDNYTQVGTLTLSFADANNGTMSYNVNGVIQSKSITRFIFATGGTNCMVGGAQGASPNYQDLWLHSPLGTEGGWGINIAHQGDTLFATWFTYLPGSGSTNKGMWLVMPSVSKQGAGVYNGDIFRTVGPAFSSVPFHAISYPANYTNVGKGTFTFTDANNGTFNYTVNGVTQAKAIARYIYATPTTVCQ